MLQCRNLRAKQIFKKIFDVATINPSWFACAVLAVITKLDGTNVLLFHVEQWDGAPWFYRVRDSAGEWGKPVSATGETVYFPAAALDRPVFVQWRSGEGDWQDAVPHEFGPATCRFTVEIQPGHGYRSGDDLRVCAAVRGCPSGWYLEMPSRQWEITAPEILHVTGHSQCLGPGQVLRHPGEFSASGRGFSIINAEPSQATLLPATALPPSAMPRQGIFMVGTGRLSDEEIAQLKQSTPPCPA
jgi:hypothetical protein